MDTGQELGQSLTIILAVGTVISYIAAAATAYFAYKAINQGEKGQQAQVFLEISRRYNEIYFARNRLLKKDLSWSEFKRKYSRSDGTINIDDLINGEEWKALREVAACFEAIGILVKHKYIDQDVLFGMILVNPPAILTTRHPPLWDRVKETVYKMRKEFNPEQWVNWEYLVEQEKAYYDRKREQEKAQNDRKSK